MLKLLGIATIAVYFLVLLCNRVRIQAKTDVSAYPPTDVSSALMEILSGRKATINGVVGVILELCISGHLKLKKCDDGIDILKLREYEEYDKFKQSVMGILFENNSEIEADEESIVAYPVCHLRKDGRINANATELINDINHAFPAKRKLRFGTDSNMNSWIIPSLALILINSILSSPSEALAKIFLVPFLYVGMKMLTDWNSSKNSGILLFSIMWNMFILSFLFNLSDNIEYFTILLASIVSVIAGYVLTGLDLSYNYLTKERQVLKGFLQLIGNKKKYRDICIEYSRNYKGRFYEVLPYVTVLGEYDNWIEQHRNVEIDEAGWIDGAKDNNLDTVRECVEVLLDTVK